MANTGQIKADDDDDDVVDDDDSTVHIPYILN